jgi:hypothetical protein
MNELLMDRWLKPGTLKGKQNIENKAKKKLEYLEVLRGSTVL